MSDLTLETHVRTIGEVVELVLARGDDRRAFVLTPADPIPARRLLYDPARWEVDGPLFDKVSRVQNWGWLRRQAHGYATSNLLHCAVGTTFYVRQWRYARSNITGPGGRPMGPIPHERFGPVFIARLADGRIFADQWASASVLYDALTRWRNASGLLVDWQNRGGGSDPLTCAIGGLDWRAIDPRA